MRTGFADLGSLLAGGLTGRFSAGATRDTLAKALPGPASADAVRIAEQEIPLPFPDDLFRLWTEVANGGFGPGGGLLSVELSVAAYRTMSAGEELPRGRTWPEQLLPIRDNEPGFECLDVESGRIVAWDPEGLAERVSDQRWLRSFSDVAPSLATWLTTWLDSRPVHEVLQERINASMIEQARAARASIAQKTPEERRAMGLPETGWERVVWGGLGLEDDEA